MTQAHFFKNAKWVSAQERTTTSFFVLRSHFSINTVKQATLHVLGLGFFHCYINGICLNPDTFLPLSSDYEASCDPSGEILSGHRIYVPSFDITPFLRPGDNSITIHFGGGWYTHGARVFGLPKAIYCIAVQEEGGAMQYHISDEACRIGPGYVTDYGFTTHECHCYDGWEDGTAATWPNAVAVEALETEYCTTDCPADRLIEELPLRQIGPGAHGGMVYDCGENTVGYPVLRLTAKRRARVDVFFAEELLPNGCLDPAHSHEQRFSIIADGQERLAQPAFTWFGFRCIEVVGDAVPTCVKVIHAAIPVTASFTSTQPTLNWTYKTFTHTMLCNMHTGHPSDCPHIERRGYTGDGQLTCHAALSTLGARSFYEKWLQDIADSQDTLSGHIQYTAPYIHSGGGPGGWGSAIVEVPYQLYKHYGDAAVLAQYYPNMRRYIDYLEAHSAFGLVVSDRAGEWCLGDWCGPNVLYPEKDITSHNQQIFIPAPLVNTYFMIKALQKMVEIAALIGKGEDVPAYQEKIETRKAALQAAYFNAFDHNFIMNAQGANAFAVDIGIGDEETYRNLVRYYQKTGSYDTGIFATDIVTRLLFERGDADLAVDLLTNEEGYGYAHWRAGGATTFHEYWDSNRSRSHNHPMFGAPVAYFFDYLLGIRQAPGTAGYTSLLIAPQAVTKLGSLAGSMETPNGTVSVRYEQGKEAICFYITIPAGTQAVFRYREQELPLHSGENALTISNDHQ